MKKNSTPAAYALVDSYGTLVVPIEVLPELAKFIRFTREYKDTSYAYSKAKDQTLSFSLMSAEQFNAVMVTAKLEGF